MTMLYRLRVLGCVYLMRLAAAAMSAAAKLAPANIGKRITYSHSVTAALTGNAISRLRAETAATEKPPTTLH